MNKGLKPLEMDKSLLPMGFSPLKSLHAQRTSKSKYVFRYGSTAVRVSPPTAGRSDLELI